MCRIFNSFLGVWKCDETYTLLCLIYYLAEGNSCKIICYLTLLELYINNHNLSFISFLFFTGTFFRHLEQGNKNDETESAALHDPGQASKNTTSDLSSSDDDDDDDELLDPDKSIADELGS